MSVSVWNESSGRHYCASTPACLRNSILPDKAVSLSNLSLGKVYCCTRVAAVYGITDVSGVEDTPATQLFLFIFSSNKKKSVEINNMIIVKKIYIF